MTDTLYISAACCIKNGRVFINGKLEHEDQTHVSSIDFLKSLYKHYNINYPKFYKMDSLCKLAFITSELVLKNSSVTQDVDGKDIAIIIANSSSSLEIDTEHQQTINDHENYFPSPANFVYTLPNILIGEIAIRNQIKGENTFFIFDKFDSHFMATYIESLIKSQKAKACIVGWVDYFENNYEAYLYIVETNPQGMQLKHDQETINKLTINN
ncbi:MAG: 3-oxoacyl-ACP synthase [Bacteroidia bacterium]|nr:3-oxoacyl-ACP synthase [Bacteroidia bacterium]